MPDKEDEVLEELYLGSDAIDLIERDVASRKTVPIKIIQPGWGTSGYYPKEVLAKDGPKAFRAGTHMFFDHPTESEAKERPERSVRDLAGVIVSDPVYRDDGRDGPGLYAEASVLPQYRPLIEQLAPHIGVSIRAHGTFAPGEVEGRKGKIIERIDSGDSVDFVTKPGAGGKVLAIMESMRQPVPTIGYVATEADLKQPIPATIITTTTGTYQAQPAASEAAQQPPTSEVASMSDELQEAQTRIGALEGELSESKTALAEATARAERAETALAVLEARKVASGELANVSLPDACKERIAAEVSANPPMADGKLDEAAIKTAVEEKAKLEAEYIERVTGGVRVTEQGTKPADSPDPAKLEESLAGHFGRFFKLSEDTAKLAAKGR